MNKKALNRILDFRGDIRSSFIFLMEVYDDLGFQLQTNLRAISDPYGTFGNAIRSYRQKGLLEPIEKSGVKLILTGRNLIQYLIIQRFLLLGAKLNDLIGSVPTLQDEELKRMLLAGNLTLNDLPVSLDSTKSSSEKIQLTIKQLNSNIISLYSIEISNGFNLVFNKDKYTTNEALKIGEMVRRALIDN